MTSPVPTGEVYFFTRKNKYMDVIFDIDGTLANASHRLHFIKDMNYFVVRNGFLKPDWDTFLSDEQVYKDTPIVPTWNILNLLFKEGNEIIFVTGRKQSTYEYTREWLKAAAEKHAFEFYWRRNPLIFMRSENDRRPSQEVKKDLLQVVRDNGFVPEIAFEDRKEDAAMWRAEGLLCYHVAEGDY